MVILNHSRLVLLSLAGRVGAGVPELGLGFMVP